MAHADLAVLGGVGVLALACLVVCAIYLYWSSDRYRERRRQEEKPVIRTEAARQNDEQVSGAGATVGTQLSHHCRTSLYRAVFKDAHDESIVFVLAASRDDARERASGALAAIRGIAAHDVNLSNLASFDELVGIGISEDEELRIFEMAWKGADVSLWAEHPLFLTDDPGLIGKWAELYADLARELAVSAIDRARISDRL